MDVSVIIPALSSLCVFKNDFLTKLSGVPLIEYAIKKGVLLSGHMNTLVITDNEEVALCASRQGVRAELAEGQQYKFDVDSFIDIESTLKLNTKFVVLLSPYAPLLEIDILRIATDKAKEGGYVQPITRLHGNIYLNDGNEFKEYIHNDSSEALYQLNRSFILSSTPLKNDKNHDYKYVVLEKELNVHLKNRHDWWLCERLIGRKKIVFRVAASNAIGMGHVYRALSLAHEIIDHEVIFVCDDASSLAVIKLSEHEYPVFTSAEAEMNDCIVNISPDLVINDFLDSSIEYMQGLKKEGIKTLNFEDLGAGAALSDCCINDLYDEPLNKAKNTLWGHDYFFVRDEFHSATPQVFKEKITAILLTFGGTDQNNFTEKFYRAIRPFCAKYNIKIFIVTGEGYKHLEAFSREVELYDSDIVEFIHQTGVISSLMEKVQLAISSNGRTVYELAHMNIPTIVISHHERESNHLFSSIENGFVNIGTYREGKTEDVLVDNFKRLVLDVDARRCLTDKMFKFNFSKNKDKVITIINSLINNSHGINNEKL